MKVKNHSLIFTRSSQFTVHDSSKILEISKLAREEVSLAYGFGVSETAEHGIVWWNKASHQSSSGGTEIDSFQVSIPGNLRTSTF